MFTGYGGFAVVNTTVVVVENNIPVLFKIEFYYNPVLNVFIFLMIMIIKTGLISIIQRTNIFTKKYFYTEKISISLFYQCCDNYF